MADTSHKAQDKKRKREKQVKKQASMTEAATSQGGRSTRSRMKATKPPIDPDSPITPPPTVEITPQQVTATIAEVCGSESARRIHEHAYPEVKFPESTEGSIDGPSPLALMTAVEPSHGDSDGSSS